MGNIKVILFDIDNTLIFGERAEKFYREYSRVLEQALAKELGISFEEGKIIADDHRKRFNGQGEKSFETMKIGIEKWYDAILSLNPQDYLDVMPQINEILRTLRSRGIIVGAITDGPTLQAKRILSVTQIEEDLFDIFIGWERGERMPKGGSVQIFESLISQLGFAANQMVMVGDSLGADILPAIEVGLNAIHINPSAQSIKNEKWETIESINSLLKIITV